MTMRASAPPAQAQLARRLGLWSSIAIVIGITIGSGIFRTPAVIATRVPDPMLMMSVWLLGGAITICGALSIAELAGSLPHTGGLYVYLREGWGRLLAFLFGWSELVLIRASAVGAIATVFGDYLLRSMGLDPKAHPATADYVSAAAIVFAALANVRGVQLGAAIVGLSTVAKFGTLAFLVLASFLLGGGRGASPAHFTYGGSTVEAGLFGLALISVLWAYDGFADLSFASGEVTNPQRNLPRAIIFGTLGIVLIYLAANAAYLYVNPIARLAQSPLVAADTMSTLFGQIGVSIVSVVVMISAFGSLNGSMLASPRVFFAMADDGLFFGTVAKVHPRYKTPYVAILLAAVLGVTFVILRTFEQLADTFVLSIWPFYAFGVGAIYRLRASRPDLPRPYRTIGYPLVPAIFIAGVLYLVLNALVTDPLWTSVTFAIVLAGIPVYYVTFARGHQRTRESAR
ncbi:MAG TPA: amino acid permease [Vicinamibacterales bacterium]|jgi:amino acid transporter|nr:amino acid permease [Vicinamibacterales bacterium]